MNRIIFLSFIVCVICSCQTYTQELQNINPERVLVEQDDIVNRKDEFNIDFLERGFSNGGGFSIDLITGNSPSAPDSYRNLFAREKVTALIINETTYDDKYTKDGISEIQRIYRYEDSLLISSYYSMSDVDPNQTYEYDSLGRLISSQNFTYVYPENKNPNERERIIYNREKYHSTEIIRIIENGCEVYTKRSSGTESSRKYIYENELLMHIIESSSMLGGEWNWVDFTYENGLLKELVNATSKKDDIRLITNILSYDEKNMSEMERQQFFQQGTQKVIDRWKFMNYDEYGNWHDSECYSVDGTLTTKYHRDIEYK